VATTTKARDDHNVEIDRLNDSFIQTRQDMIDERVRENAASQLAYQLKCLELADRDTRYVNDLHAKGQ